MLNTSTIRIQLLCVYTNGLLNEATNAYICHIYSPGVIKHRLNFYDLSRVVLFGFVLMNPLS